MRKIKEGGLSRKQAREFARQISEIYPNLKVRVQECWNTGGYEIRESYRDGSYERQIQTIESAQDFIRIHSA
jgi:hypothetical protein